MVLRERVKSLGLGLLAAAWFPLSAAGCDLNKLAADQMGGVLNAAAPAMEGFWDYEMAGAGMPGAIMQLEAMRYLSPNNEDLSLNLAKAYVGYAVGWIENEYEIADADADFDKADRLRHRARLVYLRARNLALHVMRNRDPQIDDKLKAGDLEDLRAYLREYYPKPKDIAPLFWVGSAWGAAINMSLDKPDLLADAPVVRVLMKHSAEVDPDFFHGGAYVFLGGYESSFPAALGGDPEKGKAYFEKGLEVTDRRNHMIQVMYARTYAVATANRELYVSLLREVLEAGDQGNDVRLNNKIARLRAERYIMQTPDLFD